MLNRQVRLVVQDSINECVIEDYVQRVTIEHLVQELALPLAVHVHDQVKQENQRHYQTEALQGHLRRQLLSALLESLQDLDN